jgi:hypothetical protein
MANLGANGVVGRQPLETQLCCCAKCGMDSGVRVLIRKGAKEFALVRCQQCKAETKRYEYFPAAARAWNRGDVNENKKPTEERA